jgi:asparagine synthase (glutamine-hydrolysing)
MCGIVGYVFREGENEEMNLQEALLSLHHRGPDDSGVWKCKNAGLGHTRLSIIDISGGKQPMSSSDSRYVIVFNGEIYNFLELRKNLEKEGYFFKTRSDTEVLLYLFIHEGFEKCLAQLRGMFAFAIWDNRDKTLYIARDRLGVKPLVYAELPFGFIFASEINALFSLYPKLPKEIDYDALDHYFTFQYIPSPMSAFSVIRKLPPAHAMIIRDGQIKKSWKYWDIDHSKKNRISFKNACEELREKFLEATRLRLISDVPLGAFLSGGIDSSITVAAMAHLGVNPIKTFSIGFEDEKFNELPYARTIARHFGTEHYEMIVRPEAVSILPLLIKHFGEPMADSSAIPTFYVSQFTRSKVTVALTGDGGDEIFAGYKRFYKAYLLDKIEEAGIIPFWLLMRRLTKSFENITHRRKKFRNPPDLSEEELLKMDWIDRYKHLIAYFSDKKKQEILNPDFFEQITYSKTSDYLKKHLIRAEDASGVNKYLYLDMKTYLPEDVLFKVDICSMLNSLECRSPFLDHLLIEFVTSLPWQYKLKFPRGHKYLLKEAFKEWLPKGFTQRGKMGFSVPLSSWLKIDFSGILKERLLEEKILDKLINRKTLERLINEHLSGKVLHGKQLWSLLVLSEWLKQYRVSI